MEEILHHLGCIKPRKYWVALNQQYEQNPKSVALNLYPSWCTTTPLVGQARFENCPNYYPSCLEGPRCEKWECAWALNKHDDTICWHLCHSRSMSVANLI